MGPAAVGAQAGGTALDTLGQIGATNTQDAIAKYNEQVDQQQATAARRAAAYDAARITAARDRVISAGRVAAASSGISPDFGSAGEVQRQSSEDALQDALLAVYRGTATSNQYRSQAATSRAVRPTARMLGYLGAGATLLQGGSSTAVTGKQLGVF